MCATLGLIDKEAKLSPAELQKLAEKMLLCMEHRGRDSKGVYIDGQVALGHNRLSIVDASLRAAQPFQTSNEEFILSYNGEIYNHQELRTLTSNKYQTSSDTETLALLWKDKGSKTLSLLKGMYAFGIYDRLENSVTLAVDTFGIKPLYYLDTPKWFAWASEVKAFRELPEFELLLDEEQLFEHGVFRTVVGPKTLFRDVLRVMPGESVKYLISADKSEKTSNTVYNFAPGDVESALQTSVSAHLMSDMPVGLMLSGGVDSSLIGVFARNSHLEDMHSFSIGLAHPNWNEFEYSRKVARQLKTKHHELLFTQEDFCRALPQATYHLDEPIAYPNTVAMMLLTQEASKYVKVLLSGEGADELFGGYLRYSRLLQHQPTSDTVLLSNSYCTPEEIARVFQFKSTLSLGARKRQLNTPDTSLINQLCLYDIKTFLPSLLLRQDKMGMAATVECRFPFLDPIVARKAQELPPQLKCNENEGKILLKRIAQKYLPKEIVYRKKCGFGLPIRDWLRDENGLGKYLNLLLESPVGREYLQYEYVEDLIRQHRTGEKDASEVLWILICLELWARIFLDGENPDEIWSSTLA